MRSATLLGVFSLYLFILPGAQGQAPSDGVWSELRDGALQSYVNARAGEPPLVNALRYRVFRLDEAAFAAVTAQAPLERLDLPVMQRPAPAVFTIPMPDGSFSRFACYETPVMHPELAARYPEIRTYAGQGVDDPAATIRFDKTPQGFHAQVLSPNGAVYIDPFYDDTAYIVFYKRDFDNRGESFECFVSGGIAPLMQREFGGRFARSGSQLREYRLAMACTGEYATFHGGTVGSALAAIVTTVNRVTGIYEVELAVRLTLIANNDDIIYTNGSTDPYSNDNGFALLDQNQANLDAVIGNANYDIGHVVGTGGGGLAGLGVVCETGAKAWGQTGLGSPVGDVFDVDYVAHEIGHQFGGNHTFNGITGACSGGNRNASTAYEPGSGSTIQAYAGICGTDNLQSNSDPYFHSVSFDEMFAYASVGGGSGCPTVTATGNSEPTANAGSDYVIPRGTPFTLTGSGTDANGDTLTYNWEQRDLGPAAALSAADQGTIPLFRSLNATTSPSRTFPKWSTILANTVDNAEKLPQVDRQMDFRLTVRDNRANGGGVATDDMVVTVEADAGPFVLTFPNGGEDLTGDVTVTWNVAGTTAPPISTSHVDILLSTDGAQTFGTVLADNVPNDGSQLVSLDGVHTNFARLMVRAVGNIYFDVSNANFIAGGGTPLGDPEQFTSTDVPKAVGPINVSEPVTSTLFVPDSITILDLDVALNISHTYVEDLIVDLTSPEGTTVNLFGGIGGGGENFTDTVLDDDAATSINSGSPPFTGSYKPNEFLSAFNLEDGQGTWTLTVTDTYPAADSGMLNSWSITITPPAASFDPDNVYVQFNYNGVETGTSLEPFNTLAEALAVVSSGGTIHIKPGASSETPTINQAVTLEAVGPGNSTIGEP
jgi:subtilisin-like proprotein convertase family protein